MGNYLDSPQSVKFSHDGETRTVKFGVSAMQGWRHFMEDAHLIHYPVLCQQALCKFEDDRDQVCEIADAYKEFHVQKPDDYMQLFGIYDGHGGAHVARFVSLHFNQEFINNESFNKGDYVKALQSAHLNLDALLYKEATQSELDFLRRIVPEAVCENGSMNMSMKLPQSPRKHNSGMKRHKKRNNTQSDSKSLSFSSRTSQNDRQSIRSVGSWDSQMSIYSTTPSNPQSDRSDSYTNTRRNTNTSTHSSNNFLRSLKDGFASIWTTTQKILPFKDGLSKQNNALLSGCTALTCFIVGNKLYVANAGDSRCVLCRGSIALELTVDHKPMLHTEYERIRKAGGYVEMGRVNGNLNLSRAIGDLAYKQDFNLQPHAQIVSAFPDVSVTELQEDDKFVIMGCDGIWEFLSSQAVVNFILERFNNTTNLSAILEDLFEEILSPNPSEIEMGCDNMTAILIDLKWKMTHTDTNTTA